MATPFANTLRSLNADSFHASLMGLGVALVLLIAWGSWFILARMTVYEVSTSALVASNGVVIADFPSTQPGRIRRGQAAWLYPVQGNAKQSVNVPAVVFGFIRSPSAEPAQVKLFPVGEQDLRDILPEGQKVRVEIEVESVSPAVMVLRTSGLLIDTPGVALSPQPQRGR
jgi:hypothetical protein